MKISAIERDVKLSPGIKSKAFSIKTSPQMFSILAEKLYSDKPLAVIREYCANALDAHAMNGQTKPFKIAMPSYTEPMLVIRDYGPGMEDDIVMDRFTSFGDSTKNDDPNQIGGFGLGCKAGFCYSDAFTVTSYQGDKMRTYAAFRGSDGVPQMSLIDTVDTTEPSGIEIRVPVRDSDFYRFQTTAEKLLQFFPKDSFEAFGFYVEQAEFSLEKSTFNMLKYALSDYHVMMGPIAYPLSWDQVLQSDEKAPPKHILPIFQIGELELMPSREGLSYEPVTIQRLRDRYEEICADLAKDLYEQAKTMNKWDQMLFIKECRNNGTWAFVTKAYGPNGFPSIEGCFRLPGQPELFDVNKGDRGGISVTSKRRVLNYEHEKEKLTAKEQDEGKLKDLLKDLQADISKGRRLSIEDMNAAFFVIDDMSDVPPHKKRAAARFKLHGVGDYYVYDQLSNWTWTDLEAIAKHFDGWGDEDDFLRLSDLPLPVSASAKRTEKTMLTRVLRITGGKWFRPSRYRGNPWYEASTVVSEGLFVPMNNYTLDGDYEKYLNSSFVNGKIINGLSKKACAQITKEGNWDDFERVDLYCERMLKEAWADPLVKAEHQRTIDFEAFNHDDRCRAVMKVVRHGQHFPKLWEKVQALSIVAPSEVSLTLANAIAYEKAMGIERKAVPSKNTAAKNEIYKTYERSPLLRLAVDFMGRRAINCLETSEDLTALAKVSQKKEKGIE